MSDVQDSGLVGWALAGVGGVVSALLTGVVTLFRMRESENAKAIQRLESSHAEISMKSDKCEADRVELFAKCQVLDCKLQLLEQQISKIGKGDK